MVNPRYDPLKFSNKWSELIHDPFWSDKKLGQKQGAIELWNRRIRRVVLKKGSKLTIANMKKKNNLT